MSADLRATTDWAVQAEGVRRLAHALVYDPDRADDVAQEAIRIGLERPPPDGRPVRAWLAGIVRNVARNVVRGDRHRRERERAAARPEATPAPDPWTERLAEQRRAIDAVLRLEEPYRSIVILRYFEGLSPAEVARRLGIPLETVRTRLRRARERLRAALDAAHGGDRSRWVVALLPLGREGAVPVAAGGGSVFVGAIVMKKMLAVLAVVVLVGLGVGWGIATISRSDEASGEREQASVSPADASTEVGRPTLREALGAPPVAATNVPPPVDLAAVDRDRDLHGVVVDGAGKPVPGAAVSAITPDWPSTAPGEPASPVDRVHAETASSSDGSFALRLEKGASVNLRVVAPGFATYEGTFAAAGGRVRVVLGRPGRLVVRVRDERGSPVGQASLRFLQGGSFMVGLRRPPYAFRLAGTTGEDGAYVFEGLPVEVWGHLHVEHPRLGLAFVRAEIPAGGEGMLEVVLRDGRTLRGRVTDASTGKPVADAVVGAGFTCARGVRADADGRYALPGWGGSGYADLCAFSKGFVLQTTVVGDADTYDFALVPGRVVRGRVVDESGRPVADAGVRASTDRDPYGAYAGERRSDAEGRFAFDVLDPSATYRLKVAHPAYAPTVTEPFATRADEPVDVGDVVLGAPRVVAGRVIDDTGAPVAGVEVILGREATVGKPWRVTDDLGRFRFQTVGRGTHALQVRDEGREPISRDVRVETDVLDLEVRVTGGAPFEVVVDAEGKPPPTEGLSIEVVGSDGGIRAGHPDAEGRLVFHLPAGEVRVRARGIPDGWLRPPETVVRPEERIARLSLRRATEISGVVRREDGTPLARAGVRADVRNRAVAFGQTDERGRFRFGVEPGATFDVAVVPEATERPALYGEVRGVASGTRDVVLTVREIPTDRTLVVRVVSPEGAPVPDAMVVYVDSRSARTDAEGKVLLDGLPARPIEITAMTTTAATVPLGWLAARAVDVVPEGQEVTLAFRQGTRVTGRLVAGSAPAKGQVLARRGEDFVAAAVADKDGAFVLNVDPDAHFPLTLVVSLSGDRPTEITTTLDRPPTAPIELQIPRR